MRRLKKGYHPVTGVRLPPAVPEVHWATPAGRANRGHRWYDRRSAPPQLPASTPTLPSSNAEPSLAADDARPFTTGASPAPDAIELAVPRAAEERTAASRLADLRARVAIRANQPPVLCAARSDEVDCLPRAAKRCRTDDLPRSAGSLLLPPRGAEVAVPEAHPYSDLGDAHSLGSMSRTRLIQELATRHVRRPIAVDPYGSQGPLAAENSEATALPAAGSASGSSDAHGAPAAGFAAARYLDEEGANPSEGDVKRRRVGPYCEVAPRPAKRPLEGGAPSRCSPGKRAPSPCTGLRNGSADQHRDTRRRLAEIGCGGDAVAGPGKFLTRRQLLGALRTGSTTW